MTQLKLITPFAACRCFETEIVPNFGCFAPKIIKLWTCQYSCFFAEVHFWWVKSSPPSFFDGEPKFITLFCQGPLIVFYHNVLLFFISGSGFDRSIKLSEIVPSFGRFSLLIYWRKPQILVNQLSRCTRFRSRFKVSRRSTDSFRRCRWKKKKHQQ